MIRFRESFNTQDQTRWGASGTAQYGTAGRGTGHTGSLSYSGSFSNYCTANVPAATTYFAGIAAQTPSSPTGAGLQLLQFKEQAGTKHITIQFNAAGYVEVRKGAGGSGTLLATSTTVIRSNGNYQHINGKVKVHSTLGSVDVRVDEVPVVFNASLTNINTNNGGAGTIDQVIGGDSEVFGVRSGVNFCDFAVNDTTGSYNNDWLGDCRVGFSAANLAGTHSDGTASAGTLLTCVDDVVTNGDTDYVILDGTTLPQNLSMNVEDAPSNVLSILEVAPIAIVRKDDAGADTGRLVLISGAVEDDGGGVDVAIPSSYTALQRGYERNPDGGGAWTATTYNAHQPGFRRTA